MLPLGMPLEDTAWNHHREGTHYSGPMGFDRQWVTVFIASHRHRSLVDELNLYIPPRTPHPLLGLDPEFDKANFS